jgi:hypothetical protein
MLTRLEREVITDSMLKIQSVQASLQEIDNTKIENLDAIHSCLTAASKEFRTALKRER